MIGFPKQSTDFNTRLYKNTPFEKSFDSQIASCLSGSQLLKDKKEEWSFFPFQKVLSKPFQFQFQPATLDNQKVFLKDSICIQVKNGIPDTAKHNSFDLIRFEDFLKAPSKKLSPKMQKKILSSLEKERNHFSILNNVFYPKGFILVIKERIERPIEIHYTQESLVENQGLNLRNFIFVEGSAQILEFFHSRKSKLALFLNMQTDCFVKKSAHLQHFSFDGLSEEGAIIHQLFSHLEKKSKAYFFNLSLNAGLSRWLRHIEQEEESISRLRGLSLLSGHSLADYKTRVIHKGQQGLSDQFFKSFLFDSARYIFQGLIQIEKTADESDTSLLNKNYLFSPQSSAVSFPELDICPANVKAAHGSATAPFFENNRLIFYLKSRGIDPYLSFYLVLLSLLKETFLDCPLSIQNFIKHWIEKKLISLEESVHSNL